MNIQSRDGSKVSGPNINKLIAHKMSLEAIPPGGGVLSGVEFLLDKDRLIATAKSAKKWVEDAIALIRTGAEPNPWKDAGDEEIAGELLKQIKKRRLAK